MTDDLPSTDHIVLGMRVAWARIRYLNCATHPESIRLKANLVRAAAEACALERREPWRAAECARLFREALGRPG